MRILVAGKSGQVATALSRQAEEPDMTVICSGRPDLDITDAPSISRALDAHKPDILINAAAHTAVDKAESERDAAFAANAEGPKLLASASAARNIPLLHISTDYVFSGSKSGPYVESDPTGPTGVYGESKLAGEEAVRERNPQHIILRTAWVFDKSGSNFPKTMLRLAAQRDEINVVGDQWGNPTDAQEIANALLAAAKSVHAARQNAHWGTFHFGGPDAMSWADFARLVFAVSARHGGPTATVHGISTAEYPTPARRPANSMLDSGLFEARFGYRAIPLERSVERCMPEWLRNLQS